MQPTSVHFVLIFISVKVWILRLFDGKVQSVNIYFVFSESVFNIFIKVSQCCFVLNNWSVWVFQELSSLKLSICVLFCVYVSLCIYVSFFLDAVWFAM